MKKILLGIILMGMVYAAHTQTLKYSPELQDSIRTDSIINNKLIYYPLEKGGFFYHIEGDIMTLKSNHYALRISYPTQVITYYFTSSTEDQAREVYGEILKLLGDE